MRFGRSLSLAVAAAAMMLAAGPFRVIEAADALPGTAAPDFVLKSATGSNIRLSEHRGEVVLLAFWATWCGDCRAQLEALAEMYETYGSAGVVLLVVSLDRDYRTVQKAAADISTGFPVLHDSGGEVGRLFEADSLPTLVLIDRDGRVRRVFAGYRRGDEQSQRREVESLLREF